MTSIKTTKQSVHMNVWSTEHVDVSKVYTRAFFDAFNFQNYRVYVRNVDGTLNDLSLEVGDSKVKKFSDVLGEEQTSNGYTNLPLEIDSSDDENEMGMIDTVTQYIGRFKPFGDEDKPSNKEMGGIMVSFPLNIESPIVDINDLYTTKITFAQSIYQSSKSTVDYRFIENVLRDLYIQFDYLKQMGMIYTDINLEMLFHIQNRFFIIDSENLVAIDEKMREDQEKLACTAVVRCIAKILGQDPEGEFTVIFSDIQDTRVYFVLKRLELERVFEWI
jgi:hypothetical protein